jgi:hypothetical protein
MTSNLSLAPSSITRRLRDAGLTGVRSSTISGGPNAGAVRVEAIDARTAANELIRAGYDAARSTQSEYVVIVTIAEPEPVEEVARVEETVDAAMSAPHTPIVERVAAALAEHSPIVPIASVRPYGEGRALVTISDRVIGDPQRYADTGSIAGRHYSARSALARAGYRETPAGGTQIIVEDRQPVDEPGPEVDEPQEQPRPVEWSEVAAWVEPSEAATRDARRTRSAGSRLSNAAVLSMLRNGGPWAEQDPRVVGPHRA